jgi:potassium-transporting ATPase KdpC subunit
MLAIMMPAVRASAILWVLLGLAYPLGVTGLAQIFFPDEARGSLVARASGTVIGSHLIGQQWTGPEWFHGRPSATTRINPDDPTATIPAPYNAANSGGSNLGPSSRTLVERLAADRKAFDQEQPELAGNPVPADALTASASGLDPHISPAFAALQVARVAQARGIAQDRVTAIVARHTTGRALGIFGEPHVNVLELNLELAKANPKL